MKRSGYQEDYLLNFLYNEEDWRATHISQEKGKKGLHLMLQTPTTTEEQEREPPIMYSLKSDEQNDRTVAPGSPLDEGFGGQESEPPIMYSPLKSDKQNDRTVAPGSPLDEGFEGQEREPPIMSSPMPLEENSDQVAPGSPPDEGFAESNKELASNSSTVGPSVDMFNFLILVDTIFNSVNFATITIDETFFKSPRRQTTRASGSLERGNERVALKARPDKKRFPQRNPEQNSVHPSPLHVHPEPNIPVNFEAIEMNPAAADIVYDDMETNRSVDTSNEDVTPPVLVSDTSSEYSTCNDNEPLEVEDSNTDLTTDYNNLSNAGSFSDPSSTTDDTAEDYFVKEKLSIYNGGECQLVDGGQTLPDGGPYLKTPPKSYEPDDYISTFMILSSLNCQPTATEYHYRARGDTTYDPHKSILSLTNRWC